MLDRRIKFREKVVNKEYDTTTFYFTAPKDLYPHNVPEADSLMLSVEFPTNQPEARHAILEYSPVVYGGLEGWTDIDLPYDEIEALIDLGNSIAHSQQRTDPIYVAIFNSFRSGYDHLNYFTAELEKKLPRECSVSLVNGDTFCFRGLSGQEISDLMEATGFDYNYSYQSPEDAWFVEEKVSLKAVDIIWDVDCQEDLEGLPTEVEIPDGMDEDDISDYLSDVTGFCHKGYRLEECEKQDVCQNAEAAKPSLAEQIKTAATRASEPHSLNETQSKETTNER